MDGPDHHHNLPGGGMAPPMHMHMHMTFYWGVNAQVLFTGWPGTNTWMYALTLAFVFALCFIVEGISHCRILKPGSNNNIAAGLAQTLMHAVRMGVAYMAMLAVMSFNGGVFLAAVAGHAGGFLVFSSRVFRKAEKHDAFEKSADLPPMSC